MPRVTPGYEYEEDMRTRPVAVRMTPLAYPELVKDETPEVRERARVQGHAAGYAAGRKAATETLATDRAQLRAEADRALGVQIDSLRSAVDAVRQAAGELNTQTAMSLEGTEEAVLSAAIEIAGMILGRAITEDREGAAVAALRRALEAAGPMPIRIVRLHPDDLELVSMVAQDEPGLQLVADRASPAATPWSTCRTASSTRASQRRRARPPRPRGRRRVSARRTTAARPRARSAQAARPERIGTVVSVVGLGITVRGVAGRRWARSSTSASSARAPRSSRSRATR